MSPLGLHGRMRASARTTAAAGAASIAALASAHGAEAAVTCDYSAVTDRMRVELHADRDVVQFQVQPGGPIT